MTVVATGSIFRNAWGDRHAWRGFYSRGSCHREIRSKGYKGGNEVNTAGMERKTTALSSAGAVQKKKRVREPENGLRRLF